MNKHKVLEYLRDAENLASWSDEDRFEMIRELLGHSDELYEKVDKILMDYENGWKIPRLESDYDFVELKLGE